MINRKIFFEQYKNMLDPNRKLDAKEVSAIDEFLDYVDANIGKLQMNQWAYFFATVFHETNAAFLPVREAYWLSEDWRKKNLRYYPYYGRGAVQITWFKNYQYYSKTMGVDFVNYPDLMLVPKYSFRASLDGFINGIFTGKKISDYVNKDKADYVNARRVINGLDDANLIASYARLFENILRASVIR